MTSDLFLLNFSSIFVPFLCNKLSLAGEGVQCEQSMLLEHWELNSAFSSSLGGIACMRWTVLILMPRFQCFFPIKLAPVAIVVFLGRLGSFD